jgi:hypothetical protein
MSDGSISLSAEAQRRRQSGAIPSLSIPSGGRGGSGGGAASAGGAAQESGSQQAANVALFNQAVQKMDQVFNNLPTIAVVQF